MGSLANSGNPRLGFLGGTFDPLHLGHLKIAEIALKHASLDKLLFCPAHHAPLRTAPALFSPQDRLAMVQAVCQTRPNMEAYAAEINHGETRYTIETMQEVKSQFPDHDLFLILGADQFSRLPEWKNVQTLAGLVHFLVFARHAKCPSKPDIDNLRATFMDNSLINISSTHIREHIRCNSLPESLLPPEVLRYIYQQELFPNKIKSSA